MEIITKSAEETKAVGARLGTGLKILPSWQNPQAYIILLQGDLGSGKTTFMQGFAQGLGLTGRLLSPTFTLLRSYKLDAKFFKQLYHFDLYRIPMDETEDLGIQEILADSTNIVAVEWSEKAQIDDLLQKIELQFEVSPTGEHHIHITNSTDVEI